MSKSKRWIMDEFQYTGRMIYRMASICLSLVMAAAWGGVFWLLGTEHGPVVALIVFLIMFGLLSIGERKIND